MKRAFHVRDANVVFSGSGTNYPLFIGALKALEELGVGVKSVTGTSGGAIVAGLYAVGWTPGTIEKIALASLPVKRRAWDFSPFIHRNLGLIKGERFNKIFKKWMVKGIGDPNSPPARCSDAVVPFNIVTMDVDLGRIVTYNPSYSDVLIADAVSASIAIPLMFAPVSILRDGNSLPTRHIDGGAGNSMAINLYPENELTIGFRALGGAKLEEYVDEVTDLVPREEPPFWRKALDKMNPMSDIREYGGRVFAAVTEQINRRHIEEAAYAHVINLYGYSNSFRLAMSEEEAKNLIHAGYLAAKEQLEEKMKLGML